eukprot:363983-Chlamydomonas_euryale.AAC.3
MGSYAAVGSVAKCGREGPLTKAAPPYVGAFANAAGARLAAAAEIAWLSGARFAAMPKHVDLCGFRNGAPTHMWCGITTFGGRLDGRQAHASSHIFTPTHT